jgi:diphthine-ammonia ligase
MTTALVSGGKDSLYAAYLCDTQGWPVDELVTIRPRDPASMMFHTPNLDLVALQAKAWGRRYREVAVAGDGPDAERAALETAFADGDGPVVAGAIESSYQWARLLEAADRGRRRLFAPLWRKDPARVVREEVAAGLDIRFVHLAAEPLAPELLGTRLDLARLAALTAMGADGRGVHVAGEGGEFETLVVDAPFFRRRIVLDRTERTTTASTATLTVRAAHLDDRRPSGGEPP